MLQITACMLQIWENRPQVQCYCSVVCALEIMQISLSLCLLTPVVFVGGGALVKNTQGRSDNH